MVTPVRLDAAGDADNAPVLKGSYAAPALEKAFDIIELLAATPEGSLVSEMAAQLGRSMGELFRIVIVMEKRGFLQKSPVTDRYSVAYKFLDLAYRATPARKLTSAAMPEMEILARDIEQSCHLVVPNGGAGLVVVREENPGTRGFALRLGASIDLVRSCSGQVLLAFSSPNKRTSLLHAAAALNGVSPDRQTLDAALDRVRSEGHDVRQSPITHGVTDISAPVFGFDNEIMAALTVPFVVLIDGLQKVSMLDALARLKATAATISQALGYRDAGDGQ